MRAKGVIFLVTESKNKAAYVFVRVFFRFDFEAVATADMYMRLHVMACFVLCSPNCRKINLGRSCLRLTLRRIRLRLFFGLFLSQR